MLHHVKDLSPEPRHAAEILLGHPVSEGETLSVKSLDPSTEEEAAVHEALRSSRPAYELPPEEWVRQFRAWTQSHAENTVVLPDEAMEREAIYGDRGR